MAVDENGNEIPDEPAAPEAPAPAAPPAYVPADEFKAFQATITGTLDMVRESLQAINSSRVHEPARPEAAIEDVSDADIEAALAAGQGADKFRKMLAASEARLARSLGSRMENIETTAGNSLSDMALQMAKPQMKYYEKPQIKKKIDAYVAQLPMHQKLTPQNYLVVYNAVVGEHMSEIIQEEVEAALRKKAASGNAAVPGSSNGRSNESPTTQTVKEVFGEDAERALRSEGRSLDAVARGFGFKNGEEYLKYARGEQEGEGNVQ